MSTNANLFLSLVEVAERQPEKVAIVSSSGKDAIASTTSGQLQYRELRYAELVASVERCSAALAAAGIREKMRVMLLVIPGPDFVVILNALMRLGAVAVFVDPGHPFERLRGMIKEAAPQALIAIPVAFMLKAAQPELFPEVSVSIVVGEEQLPGVLRYADLDHQHAAACPVAAVDDDDMVILAFTSGTTGVPKGVELTPRTLRSISAPPRLERYAFGADDVDLTMFPITLLMMPALGMTLVLPTYDPASPGKVDPAGFVELVRARGCTTCLGSSPVFWSQIADFCGERGITLPSLRVVLLSGAPVPATLLRRLRDVLPNAVCHTPIGSTECGSVASIAADEVIAETAQRTEQGAGLCVGRPFSDHPVRVIALRSQAQALDERAAESLPRRQIGEIIVQGPGVSPRYYLRPEATLAARISAADGGVWHRTGDVGYLDELGRLWFCGRASQVIERGGERYYPVVVEGVFNADPSVFRSGLVCLEAEGLVLCVEFQSTSSEAEREAALARIWQRASAGIAFGEGVVVALPLSRVLVNSSGFPVDARHNAKIDYAALTTWAAAEIERLGPGAGAGATSSQQVSAAE